MPVSPLLLCIFTPFLPPSFQIEKDKYKVFLIFMHVPVVVVRRLLQQAQTGFDNARLALDPNIGLEVDEDAEREQEVPRLMD